MAVIQGYSSISNLSGPTGISSTALSKSIDGSDGVSSSGPSFKDYLVQSIQEVNNMQAAADQAVEKLATGGDVNPAEVLTAVQKADIAFQMMIQVRNKLTDAFTEIKNLQI
jgi:flagellar hook-basal body complex protein FliE